MLFFGNIFSIQEMLSCDCSSDIKMASCVQAYLAFYVINDLRMAQSAKALVCTQTLSKSNFFQPLIILENNARVIILSKLMGAGSCHNLYLQLHHIYDSAGTLMKPSSLVESDSRIFFFFLFSIPILCFMDI